MNIIYHKVKNRLYIDSNDFSHSTMFISYSVYCKMLLKCLNKCVLSLTQIYIINYVNNYYNIGNLNVYKINTYYVV